MENWYKFLKGQVKRQVKIGEYEVLYSKKELKEDSFPKEEGKPTLEINKETVKVLRGGNKVKIRKAEKLRLIEAIKADNLENIEVALKELKAQ